MNTRSINLFLIFFTLQLPLGTAYADAAAAPPAELRASLPQARLSGAAKMRVFGFEVYLARLWVAPGFEPSRFAEHDFALELQYLRQFKGADIAQRSLTEMQRVAKLDEAQAQQWLQTMLDIFPTVQRGDRITGVHEARGGARFLKNGQALGEVKDPQFAQAFFAIWLSPQTSQPRLREQLLAHARAPAP